VVISGGKAVGPEGEDITVSNVCIDIPVEQRENFTLLIYCTLYRVIQKERATFGR
jgi:hypothetical protein